MFPFRAVLAALLVLVTAGAMPTSVIPFDVTSVDMPSPKTSFHQDMVRNAMHEAVLHRVDNDSWETAIDDDWGPSENEVNAIKACIGRPTLQRMKWCMREAAERASVSDDRDCVASEQLERVWRCVERQSRTSPRHQDHSIDASLIPHQLYGKDKAAPPSSSSILILKDDGYGSNADERLVKRKYGYGPNWLTAVGVRRAHPLP